MSNLPERMYTPVEIASILKVNRKTVLGWLRDEAHPLVGQKIGNLWRVTQSNFVKFLEGRE